MKWPTFSHTHAATPCSCVQKTWSSRKAQFCEARRSQHSQSTREFHPTPCSSVCRYVGVSPTLVCFGRMHGHSLYLHAAVRTVHKVSPLLSIRATHRRTIFNSVQLSRAMSTYNLLPSIFVLCLFFIVISSSLLRSTSRSILTLNFSITSSLGLTYHANHPGFSAHVPLTLHFHDIALCFFPS